LRARGFEGELRALKSNLLELTNSVIRLRGQVREIEMQAETQIQSRMSQVRKRRAFDPLEFDRYTRFQELSRSLAEGVNDVATVQQALMKNLDDADAALMAQARLSRESSSSCSRFARCRSRVMSERLYRLLRQTAKELDKKANLEIAAADGARLAAFSRSSSGRSSTCCATRSTTGLEDRAGRAAAGKPEIGEVAISVRQEGNEDTPHDWPTTGAGCRFDAIRAKAVAVRNDRRTRAPTQEPTDRRDLHAGFTTRRSHARFPAAASGWTSRQGAITASAAGSKSRRRRTRNDVHAVPAADAGGDAGVLVRPRPDLALPACWSSRCSSQGEMCWTRLRAAKCAGRRGAIRLFICTALLGEDRCGPESAALQPGAAAEERQPGRRDPRRRDARQPGNRHQEHRAPARRHAGPGRATVLGTGEIV
jgi:hypothetical protein